jgi:hypothetical protein
MVQCPVAIESMPSMQRADGALNARLCHGLTGEAGITRLRAAIGSACGFWTRWSEWQPF